MLGACRKTDLVSGTAGEPLSEVDTLLLARFRAGQALFNRVFSPADGVGPLFNENQCSACHTDPAAGGTGEQVIIKATRFTPPNACDLLPSETAENVRKQATPALAAYGIRRQPFPLHASEMAKFIVPFVFGLGAVEAIPEAEIMRRSDARDADGDGISGRPGRDTRGRFARFGRKADVASLPAFVESAAHLEMGLTTPHNPTEAVPVNTPDEADIAADPELSAVQVALLTDFVRLLAPPARRRIAPSEMKSMRTGERLFHQIGCAACHTPSMPTSSGTIKALDRKRVALYSDLLLHDMGKSLTGVCAPGAAPAEWRTAMLMGLRSRERFLHDGRARDVSDAIIMHGGEAAAARSRFSELTASQREALLKFLRTL